MSPAIARLQSQSRIGLPKEGLAASLKPRSALGGPSRTSLPPEAWAEDAFVGRYTDPINHPGGIRDITLTDTFIGEYRLVKVVGGGGRGEPNEYILPGLVDANRITVDFSVPPKGGPPNLTGVLTLPTPGRPGATAIVWPDGNKWPQEKKN